MCGFLSQTYFLPSPSSLNEMDIQVIRFVTISFFFFLEKILYFLTNVCVQYFLFFLCFSAVVYVAAAAICNA